MTFNPEKLSPTQKVFLLSLTAPYFTVGQGSCTKSTAQALVGKGAAENDGLLYYVTDAAWKWVLIDHVHQLKPYENERSRAAISTAIRLLCEEIKACSQRMGEW